MNESGTQREGFADLSREEIHSAHFAQMILQLSNMAMLVLGKVPDPRSGQTLREFEAAQLFIGQLEALEAKTKGNLTKEEESLLKQTLMALRLAFVEAVESPAPSGKTAETAPASKAEAPPPSAAEKETAPTPNADAATEETSSKRFSKKYSS